MFQALLAKLLGRIINRSDVQAAIDRFIDSGIVAAKDWLTDQRKDPDTREMGSRLKNGGLRSAIDGEIRSIALKQCAMTGASLFSNAKHTHQDLKDVAFLCPAELCQVNTALAVYDRYRNLNVMCSAMPDNNQRVLALLSLGYASVRTLLVQKRINYASEIREYLSLGNQITLIWGSRKNKEPMLFDTNVDYFLFGHKHQMAVQSFLGGVQVDFARFDRRMVDYMANHLSREKSDAAGRAWANLIAVAVKRDLTADDPHCPKLAGIDDAYVFCEL